MKRYFVIAGLLFLAEGAVTRVLHSGHFRSDLRGGALDGYRDLQLCAQIPAPGGPP